MRLPALVAFVLFYVVATAAGDLDNEHLKCLVCRAVMGEMKKELDKIDPKLHIDVGNYRLDAKGNEIRKTIPKARSAVHISEVLDDICKKLEDYVRATYKSNHKLTIMPLMLPDGGMNPDITKVDIVQDGDLNTSLGHLCAEVIADDEEEMIEFFQKGEYKDTNEICASVCEGVPISEEDDTIDENNISDNDEL